jgi:DNA mismatch repair ATPase MutS
VLAAASVRGNPFLWMALSVLTPWDLYVMRWLDRCRSMVAALLPGWLDVWFELEALGSLANLAYLNPDYVFPELVTDGRAVFEAEALGHPLIPDDERVCNDFTLHDLGELTLITGSNMSGKSTFLRTLGMNLCLAYAGGPVNARDLRTAPFRLFTSIRLTDSVTDGISYFYAEVKRLKALLSALEGEHRFPLFFLIDEIFRGTNNRERLIGSRSYIRALVEHGQTGGAGVVSTHDLELVHLADEMPQIKNHHFEETIAGGQMLFDYKLRPGPCPTTNALQIMRLEGLPVDL